MDRKINITVLFNNSDTGISPVQEKLYDKYSENNSRKVNDENTYMFLCSKDKFIQIKEKIKEIN